MEKRYSIVLLDTIPNPKKEQLSFREYVKRYVVYDGWMDKIVSPAVIEGSPEWLLMVRLNTVRNDNHTKEFKDYNQQLYQYLNDIDYWEANEIKQ